jgi:hypothetical protein
MIGTSIPPSDVQSVTAKKSAACRAIHPIKSLYVYGYKNAKYIVSVSVNENVNDIE